MAKLTIPVSEQDHTQGSADAAVTLVEYGDYQCPTCGEAYPIVKKLEKHFGDKLRFAYRNFPLPQHDFAEPAAETAEFAATQGKFWQMHDALYENQRAMSDDLFPALARKLGLDQDALSNSLQQGTYEDRVQQDMDSGEASGVHGTPTFYINGKIHSGSFDYESLVDAITAKS